jgi:hypothetical protein
VDPPIHRYEQLTTPTGDLVNVDVEMVRIIRHLWQLGLATVASCQDVGEATAALRDLAGRQPSRHSDGFIAYHKGYALLKMPRPDALRLVIQLLDTPFRDRISLRWRQESWRIHVPVIRQGATADLADTALIHFPRTQLNELSDMLDDLTLPSRIDSVPRSP